MGQQVLPLIASVVIATLVSSYAHADKARIAEIKALYGDVSAKIKAKAIKAKVVEATVMVAGIGSQTRRVTFYQRADRSLAKVELSYNVAASGDYTTQYLYDDKERLAFTFAKSRSSEYCDSNAFDVRGQERFYLSTKGTLVRYLLRRHDPDASPDDVKGLKCAPQIFARRRADGRFKSAELKAAKLALKRAGVFARLHTTLKQGGAKAVRKVLGTKAFEDNLY